MAVTADELKRLYTDETLERLQSFAKVTFGESGEDGRTGVPIDVAHEYDALVTCWSTHPLSDASLAGKRLNLLAHTAGSVRRLVPRPLLEAGMRVTQCGAAAMAPAVAELAVTLALALLRHVHTYDRNLRGTRHWNSVLLQNRAARCRIAPSASSG